MNKITKLLPLILMATLLLSACDPNKLQFFINAKTGDNYTYNVTIDQTTKSEILGLETRTKQTISYDYSVNVDDVKSNGDLELTYTYDRIRFNMNMDDIEVSFDSDSATSGDEISKIYKSFIGKQFNVIMTKYGEIKEVKGMDEFLDTLTEPFKSGNTDIFGLDYLNQLKDSLSGHFSEESIKNDMGLITRYMPKKKVNVGDSWTIKESIDKSNIKIDAEITYTLEKLEDEIAYIIISGTYSTNEPSKISYDALKANVNLEGNIEGNIQADINNGFIFEGEITQNIKSNMDFGAMDLSKLGIEGNLENPMETTLIMKFSSKKAN